MIYGYKYEPLLIRVPTWIDNRYQIQGYDQDNLYPQRAKEARNRSYTLRIACLRYAEFLSGDGFTDKALANMVVHSRLGKKLVGNQLLNTITDSVSWANGYYIYVGYNLNYKVNSVKLVPFEFPRFGIPDAEGNFHEFKYSTNWENNPYKNPSGVMEIDCYPAFNPDPAVVKDQIEAAGGILNYKGQLFCWTPEEGQYSKATFDAVFDQAQTQSEIAIFDLAMEQNGFKAGHAIAYPGKFESRQERDEFKDDVNSFTGQGAGGALIIENEDGQLKIQDMITTLQMQNTDGLHVNVDKRVRDAIRVNFGMPAEIIGEMPETGMFNKQQMQEAYEYYNTITRRQRASISNELKKIFDHWYQPITTDFSIIEQQYGTKAPGVAITSPGIPAPDAPAPTASNTTILKLSGKEMQNFERILRKYGRGTLTRTAAEITLKTGFGFTDKEIHDILDAQDAIIHADEGQEVGNG